MLLLVVVFSFLCAAAIDGVGIAYHAAREARRWRRGTALAMLHEALTWAPILVAVQGDDVGAAMLAAIAGVAVANAWGLR